MRRSSWSSFGIARNRRREESAIHANSKNTMILSVVHSSSIATTHSLSPTLPFYNHHRLLVVVTHQLYQLPLRFRGPVPTTNQHHVSHQLATTSSLSTTTASPSPTSHNHQPFATASPSRTTPLPRRFVQPPYLTTTPPPQHRSTPYKASPHS
ncbi:hypothetical protein BDQ17DRAFT_1371116 [Cyathus striatus]|nr:hypothetical protein BDQ17DRAFT_1371116 [Cyathus striatus]